MLAFFDWETQKLRWRRAPKNPRAEGERTQPPGVVTPPAAQPSGGVTPVAQVTTIESVKDVVPSEKSGLPGTLGYVYYEYEYLEPVDNAPQVLLRVIRINPYGRHFAVGAGENEPVVATNAAKIKTFWADLPSFLLDKIYRRDGISFLPETFDNGELIEWRELLITACIMQLRTIRTLIDTTSWNEGTRGMRESFARKNRRCLEAENNLATIETSPLWSTIMGQTEPVISPRSGGPILITLPDLYEIASHFVDVDSTHPAFLNKAEMADQWDLVKTSNAVDQLLGEVENAIRILRHRDDSELVCLDGNSGTPNTWISGDGRGVQADVKFITKMLHELKYPAVGNFEGAILVDLGRWNQKLYGEALYGVDLEGGTPNDTRHDVGYPMITEDSRAVYRRGFEAFSPLNEAGLDEIWGVESDANDNETLCLLGFKCQVGLNDSVVTPSKFGTIHIRRDGTEIKPAFEYNFDDGTSMRAWLGKSFASDHQWNEGVLIRAGGSPVVKPDQPAVYGVHQPVLVPFEGYRKYLCEAYNVPFQR